MLGGALPRGSVAGVVRTTMGATGSIGSAGGIRTVEACLGGGDGARGTAGSGTAGMIMVALLPAGMYGRGAPPGAGAVVITGASGTASAIGVVFTTGRSGWVPRGTVAGSTLEGAGFDDTGLDGSRAVSGALAGSCARGSAIKTVAGPRSSAIPC